MVRRFAVLGGVAVLLFYVVTTPQTAAGTFRKAGSGLGYAAHQISVFLRSLG